MKTRRVLLLFLMIVLLSSCTVSRSYRLGTYFMDSAYVLDYESRQNKLYAIKIPLDVLVSYGLEKNLETVPQAIQDFAEIKTDAMVVGTPGVLSSIKRILTCWTDEDSPQGLLEAMVSHAQDLSKEPLSSKINKLCSTDVSRFITYLCRDNIEVVYMDCTDFLNAENALFSKKYFEIWFRQLLGVRL